VILVCLGLSILFYAKFPAKQETDFEVSVDGILLKGSEETNSLSPQIISAPDGKILLAVRNKGNAPIERTILKLSASDLFDASLYNTDWDKQIPDPDLQLTVWIRRFSFPLPKEERVVCPIYFSYDANSTNLTNILILKVIAEKSQKYFRVDIPRKYGQAKYP
jgi:hypothetical protein